MVSIPFAQQTPLNRRNGPNGQAPGIDLAQATGPHSTSGNTLKRRDIPAVRTLKGQPHGILIPRTKTRKGGFEPNTWRRFERLSSAWNQSKLRIGGESVDAPEGHTRVS